MFVLNEENKKVYKVLSEKEVKEENIFVVEIEHIITKAKIVLFVCEDENRVFNIAFKTPVENEKGTPHILEHSVLCGSRKYNIKDPFIELAKGSMNTFLNAMTFPDKTCYPVASANLKDFHNLVDVYLDAVFYPNAIKNDKIFKQEGWHYEIENEKDDLKVNGVVYNEMKGVYSNPDSILETAILSNLFSKTNYAYESGGNPSEIIDLSYDEFVDFHHKYYSATNSIIYFYGKLDFNEELYNLHNNYLKDMKEVKLNVEFKDVLNVVHDKEQVDYYNLDTDDLENKSYIAYSFVFPFEKSSINNIAISIINYVLFRSDSAILKDKLMNDGFGKSIECHVDTSVKNAYYSIVSKNINANKKDAFVKTILSFISDIVENGLDIEKFKAGINSVYFNYAEGEIGRIPKGLLFSLALLDTYLYGEGITNFIEYKEAFDYIKKIDLSDKNNIFIKLLRELFLDNKWTAINILKPKNGYLKEKNEKLKILLKDKKDKIGIDGINDIINDIKELKAYQKEDDSEEARKAIPLLKVSDIDKYKKIIDYDYKSIDGIDSIICYKNDKDIVYINISFDISNFSKEEIYFISLLKNIIGKIDFENISYKELDNYININTGGIEYSISVFEKKCLFTFSIKSTIEKIGIAFEVLYKVMSQVIFNDSKKIEIIINEEKNKSLLSILSSGHTAAITRSLSNQDYFCWMGDKISTPAVGHYNFIKAISNSYAKNHVEINETLNLLFKKILSSKMYFEICINENHFHKANEEFLKFKELFCKNILNSISIDDINNNLLGKITEIREYISFDDFDKKYNREAIVTSNDVNFCAISGAFDKKLFSGKLDVLRTLFNYEYLWTNIRVLGGAYGCMSSFKRYGYYSLVSFRDPNVTNTNKVFIDIPNFLKKLKLDVETTEKYIIGSIGVFDNPISIYENFQNNIAAYFNNQTDEEFNKRRNDILNMKPEDFNSLDEIFKDINNASACALISENKFDEAMKEYDIVWKIQD